MNKEIQTLAKTAKKIQGQGVDLSLDEDLSIALMNLVSLEEHCYFSTQKTQDPKYLKMLDTVRSIRKDLLEEIVTEPQGEEWCMSKHLLATSMRLIEVGNKELSLSKKYQNNMYYQYAFDLYALFWEINSKKKPKNKNKSLNGKKSSSIYMERVRNFVKKSIDCCKEV